MTNGAKSLKQWKRHLNADPDRARSYRELHLRHEALMLSEWREPRTIEAVQSSSWGQAYAAAHPDDRVVFDMARIYAGLQAIASDNDQGPVRRRIAQNLAASLEGADPIQFWIPLGWTFLDPISAVVELKPNELANASPEELQTLRRSMRSPSPVDQERLESIERLGELYRHDIQRGNPVAKSKNNWCLNAPRKARALFDKDGPKTLSRALNVYLKSLKEEDFNALVAQQRELNARETKPRKKSN